jgi:hypothetical protein
MLFKTRQPVRWAIVSNKLSLPVNLHADNPWRYVEFADSERRHAYVDERQGKEDFAAAG